MLKKIFFLIFANATLIFAQTDTSSVPDTAKSYRISIISNLEDAKIYLDTSYIGKTPLLDYAVKEGKYVLKVVNPKSLLDWENENEVMNLNLSGDTTINLNFNYYYYFDTNPFNASVFKNDSLMGLTPLRFFSQDELSGNLVIKRKNYKDFVFDLKNYNFETGENITLQSKGKESINDIVYKNRGTQFKTRRNLYTVIGMGAASIVGGYFAIKFKNKANTAYDNYVSTGNTAQLNESNSNDTYFVISLVLMQMAVGGLIYFLFFDK
ncbi:MAG: PEGA domain-containing protein [bacterium]